MKYFLLSLSLIFLFGCRTGSPSEALDKLVDGCTTRGMVTSVDLPQPTRGYAYSYRVYLPPCYSAEAESRYPVLYLIPGRSSSPDTWFAAGLLDIVDQMILDEEIPPFIIITTENIENDPMADIIYKELIPVVESQYPILDDRQYRAVSGGSLGGIAAYRLAFQYPDTFSSAGIFGAGAISGEEIRIDKWLSAMNDKNKIRVFMDIGDEDPLMLERAKVMKSMLDDMGIENQFHSGHGGHTYAYWISNFKMYLQWLAKDW